MARGAVRIQLREAEEETLRLWLKVAKAQQRMAERARIILLAAAGNSTERIAAELGTRPARVSKWRTRFASRRLAGLADSTRTGKPPKYDAKTEERILSLLSEEPPGHRKTWTSQLLASMLGDVSVDHVRRFLRRRGWRLAELGSQPGQTRPEFVPKIAEIAGLYLSSAARAFAVAVGVPPSSLPAALAPSDPGLSSSLPRWSAKDGSPRAALVSVLEAATAKVSAGRYTGRPRRRVERFVSAVAEEVGTATLLVLLHTVQERLRLPRQQNVIYHLVPTTSDWLSEVEVWLATFHGRSAPANAACARDVTAAMAGFLLVGKSKGAAVFEWRRCGRRSRRGGRSRPAKRLSELATKNQTQA